MTSCGQGFDDTRGGGAKRKAPQNYAERNNSGERSRLSDFISLIGNRGRGYACDREVRWVTNKTIITKMYLKKKS